jgi:hypothetical protein
MPNCERCPNVCEAIEVTVNNVAAVYLGDPSATIAIRPVLEQTSEEVSRGCEIGPVAMKVARTGLLGAIGVKRTVYQCTSPRLTSKQPQ